jgi:lipoprotein-anchoring transpeptidase ErfK/SrfK
MSAVGLLRIGLMKTLVSLTLFALLAAGCSRERASDAGNRAQETAKRAADRIGDAGDSVPLGGKDDPAAQERERFDEGWRQLDTFRAARAAKRAAANAVRVRFAAGGKESFEGLNPEAIDTAPVVVPLKGDVSGPSVLKTQVYLDRLNFSVGALDGRWGRNTAIALWWYQRSRGIEAAEPGALDEETFRQLVSETSSVPAVTSAVLTAEDIAGPFVRIPEDVYEQEDLDCLCYESLSEKLAERFHTTAALLARLNPQLDLDVLAAGQKLLVPNVRGEWKGGGADIAKIVISIRGNTFNAFDAAGNLVFHAPTTLGSKYDPSPRETLQVVKATFDPWFHYQPTLFSEVPDEEPEANLHPGPNSPVGVVWVALSKPHYGIHGTSSPETIGYASSHGCVRLTNWDARELGHRVTKGVEVEFLDTKRG